MEVFLWNSFHLPTSICSYSIIVIVIVIIIIISIIFFHALPPPLFECACIISSVSICSCSRRRGKVSKFILFGMSRMSCIAHFFGRRAYENVLK